LIVTLDGSVSQFISELLGVHENIFTIVHSVCCG